MLEDCEHDGGSLVVTVEKLKMLVHRPFSKNFQGGLFNFVDQFQTNMEELGALNPRYSDDETKLDTLVTALRRVPSETSYYLDYIQNEKLSFRAACAYLRERAMLKSTFDDSGPKKFNKVIQDQENEVGNNENEYQQVYTIMQNWANETNAEMSHVYATMNASPPLRESLMIPTKLWMKLAPDIKKAVMEARRVIENEEKKPATTSTAGVPRQYSNPSRANAMSQNDGGEQTSHQVMVATRNALKTQGLLMEDSSEDDSDDYQY
jgi:hypothetical protein